MTKSERASQIWAVLAFAAKNRQSLTYGILSRLIGVPAAGLGKLLEPIQSYCLIEGLPPLTILVVQQDTGLPGSGFTGAKAEEFAKDQMKVLASTGSSLGILSRKNWKKRFKSVLRTDDLLRPKAVSGASLLILLK